MHLIFNVYTPSSQAQATDRVCLGTASFLLGELGFVQLGIEKFRVNQSFAEFLKVYYVIFLISQFGDSIRKFAWRIVLVVDREICLWFARERTKNWLCLGIRVRFAWGLIFQDICLGKPFLFSWELGSQFWQLFCLEHYLMLVLCITSSF